VRKTEKQSQQPMTAEIREAKQPNAPAPEPLKPEALIQEQEKIAQWLKEVKFRRKLLGGVNEQEVWKKIEELNKMYADALKAERLRYDVLLEQQSQTQIHSPPNGHPTEEIQVDE
jgi:hypothetical protein